MEYKVEYAEVKNQWLIGESRAGKKKLAARERIGLGSERLASLERAEPSLFSRLAKIPSRASSLWLASRLAS